MKKKKDVEVKIYDKEEAFWTDVKERSAKEIEALEKALKLQRAVFNLCKSNLSK